MKRDEWTGRLSEYLDDELTGAERQDVEAHLAECPDCQALLADLRRVVHQAQALPARPPQRDLWPGIAPRIAARRRFSFTLPQLAAASILIAAASGVFVWRVEKGSGVVSPVAAPVAESTTAEPRATTAVPVSLADAQYDAAVADLQLALERGRGHLDPATIAIVEQNLKIIDRAIAEATKAVVDDPANSYLTGHLVETRRKKLDLLRRAAALASETD